MGAQGNIFGAIFWLVLSSVMVLYSEKCAAFLAKVYRRFPHYKGVSDKQFEVRPIYILALGGLVFAISLLGLISNLS